MISVLQQIVDLARWAPSGDNSQPWRFEILPPGRIVLHGHDTRRDCVYDLRGEASQLSIGALLFTLDLAASGHGMSFSWKHRAASPADRPTFDLLFTPNNRPRDPLIDFIRHRSVQRRPMGVQALSARQVNRLEQSAGPNHRILWLQQWSQRLATARLLFSNAGLRLTLPEAFAVHRRIIAWDARESEDRIPDQALGASWPTLRLMRFGLVSWDRVRFFNRFLAGTWLPRIELDLVPALACSTHFVLLADHEPNSLDDFLAAGQAVQRVWLTATAEGLWQQPEMTPLIFARYARQKVRFTQEDRLAARAERLAQDLQTLVGQDAASAVWMGRLGPGPAPLARSTRLPLSVLTTPPSAADGHAESAPCAV